MKKIIPFILLLVCTVASAQNIQEALQYSKEDIQGTARYQAMGGAFGALGGDLSSLHINPAGSAVFNNSLATLSGSFYNTQNDVSYFRNRLRTNTSITDLNQFGGVFVLKNTNSDSDWKKFSLAANYDVVANFENTFFANGNSADGLDSYFLEYAQGIPFGSIALQEGEFIEDAYLDIGAVEGFGAQQAFLGIYGGFINPVTTDGTNTGYVSNASYDNVNQNYSRQTGGYNSKFTANVGSQYKDNLYLGASLNFHTIIYSQFDQLSERGYNDTSVVQNGSFDNYLSTNGSGFSFSLGAIAKLNDFVRLGGSYQSATWYRLNDEFSQRINSNDADADISFIDFNQINIFETYTIKTPSKLTGSLAFVFGKQGLISLDYSYQDLSNTTLGPVGNSSFQAVNTDIANQLGAVSTFRLGGEYRIQRVSLRGGYRFEQSPYLSGNNMGDFFAISGGLGYNFGGSKLDFALSRSERNANASILNAGVTNPLIISRLNTNATLSYTINF